MGTRATLDKKTLSRAIGRRINVSNAVAAAMIDCLIEVVGAELAAGGRLELSNFLILEVQTRVRLQPDSDVAKSYRVLKCRPGKQLRQRIKQSLAR